MDISSVPLLDVIRSLSFVGDLAMGQPTDHSPRAAWIAGQLARAVGADDATCRQATAVALLRWSGCTANAPEFAQLFGDDVSGRKALLAIQSSGSSFRSGTRRRGSAFHSLSSIHCEVSGDIAAQLGLDEATQFALRHLFESYDGSGAPDGLSGDRIPAAVFMASLAGDLEIFNRLYGLDQACKLIGQRADVLYPLSLAKPVIANASQWLAALEDDPTLSGPCSLDAAFSGRTTSLEILAHVIDLKLPWMTGYSLRVAQLARDAAHQLGLDAPRQQQVYRAALIHGMGRAAVPNMIWDTPGKLAESAWERVRLVPYWTGRAARQIGSLSGEAEVASYAYERTDGSGYYREARAEGIPIEGRILAAAAALAALCVARPWRDAFAQDAAGTLLMAEADAGRYDADVVRALLKTPRPDKARLPVAPVTGLLTQRERDVLRWISLGASNKVVAQKLSISPSTVRTHVESVFRKLECSTRAAATLKATQLGLL
ncbi:HD-GYP domain-containing protein (c-di-GMP phosphodiesterase class II) [Lysobacter niastensis]|uniref:HD-GYP domain-containing protein (C-di-GMP phosphodiesterase class II) n=1 Tax=Lysobacter niastensis TaxID=380629 RepID=A0ABU1WEL2_9GAMM|nr:HD domain-containing phosphohydrolase [Lysobacter niastensis]MDR7136041.1 HD-GYP domain-containing protein (c-di-GMP phosphodiesterase class II) [Lysobacter niastensis]